MVTESPRAPQFPGRSTAHRRSSTGLRPRRRTPARYAAIIAIILLAGTALAFGVHLVRTDPRDARQITERELRLNTLHPSEHVVAKVSVFQRPAIDYYRATRGLLVLTDQRLLYLGLQPRDLLSGGEGPPTFVERDFSIDTLVQLSPKRTFFFLANGVRIATPRGRFVVGVPSGSWDEAQVLMDSLGVRHKALYAEGARQATQRAAAESERQAAEVEARKAKYYVVSRGDALGSIASRYGATPEQIRSWNKLPANVIKVGETLLVRPAAR